MGDISLSLCSYVAGRKLADEVFPANMLLLIVALFESLKVQVSPVLPKEEQT